MQDICTKLLCLFLIVQLTSVTLSFPILLRGNSSNVCDKASTSNFLDKFLLSWSCKTCYATDFRVIQEQCAKEMDDFSRSPSLKNNTLVCSLLVDVFFCVGDNVPQCLFNITESYKSYYTTPYDCHLTEEERLKIQNYEREKCATSTQLLTTEVTPSFHFSTEYKVLTSMVPDPNCSSIRHANCLLLLFMGVFLVIKRVLAM